MSEVQRLVPFWHCMICGDEWQRKAKTRPRRCRSCNSVYWWDGVAPVRPAPRARITLVKPLKGKRVVVSRSPLSVLQQMKQIGNT